MTLHPQRAALLSGLQTLSLDLPDTQVAQLLQYLDLIARWNKVYNLTAVRHPDDMLTQHLLDCLAVVQPMRAALAGIEAPRVLDVGSGAGLPGIVLAILQPGWQVTTVDTVAKKAAFMRQVGAELGLANLNAVHQRVEAMGGLGWHLVTSRAFASLLDFVSLTRERLLPVTGTWVAMKAKLSSEERAAVPADIDLFHVEPVQVPGLDAERCLVWMRPRTG